MNGFAGQTAIVVGAGRGIGAAIASVLADRGASLVMVDRLAEVEGLAAAMPTPATAVLGDAADPQVIRAAIEAASGHRSRLSTLVYAAAYQPQGTVLEASSEDWDLAYRVGVKGAWQASAAFATSGVRGPASITIVSSLHAYQAYAGNAAYGTAKAALLGLTRSLAVELGPSGIRCNAVAPGFIAVERNQRAWADPEQRRRLAGRNPLGRVGLPQDVARVVAFLASEDAAHVNGVCIPVDGGKLASAD